MLEKKIDKLIDSITPALLNTGNAPTDYNEVYKIISNAVQVVKMRILLNSGISHKKIL